MKKPAASVKRPAVLCDDDNADDAGGLPESVDDGSLELPSSVEESLPSPVDDDEEPEGEGGDSNDIQIPSPQVADGVSCSDGWPCPHNCTAHPCPCADMCVHVHVHVSGVLEVAKHLDTHQLFAEYYSPPRVAPVAGRLMPSGPASTILSLDLLTGWDFKLSGCHKISLGLLLSLQVIDSSPNCVSHSDFAFRRFRALWWPWLEARFGPCRQRFALVATGRCGVVSFLHRFGVSGRSGGHG